MTTEALTITNAIVAALTFAGKTGATETVKKAAADGYDSLKSLLHRRYGADSKPSLALAELEEEPESEGCRLVLGERLAKVNAGADPEVAAATQSLLAALSALPSGEQHIQTVTGNWNVVADHGSTGQINNYGPAPIGRIDG